jgi:kynurenine formamidase
MADVDTDGESAAEQVFALGRELSNWGVWGADDEKGALNFITPEHRVRAAAIVRRGAVFSLALTIRDGKGPMRPFPAGRFNPVHRVTVSGLTHGPFEMGGTCDFTDDLIMMGTQTSTQWDALCHVYYGNKLYNGFPASSMTDKGAERDGIDKVAEDMVARGVLLDIARFHGVESLESGHAITSSELDECAERQNVEIRDGDMVLIRTGYMTKVVDDDWDDFYADVRPGLHYSTASWIKEHRISAVAADNNAVEAGGVLKGIHIPLHMLILRDMGVHIGEFWYLEDLAADCADDHVYEFMLVAPPLRIEGGAGSPINPLALK